MNNIQIKLLDNDQVIHAKMELSIEKSDKLIRLLQDINEDFVLGDTVYLEIEGFKKDPMTFEISQCE